MLTEETVREIIRFEIARAMSSGSTAEWLSQQEAADYCGVTVATVRNWHKQGLAPTRVGRLTRYSRQSLDAFVSKQSKSDVSKQASEILSRR